MESSVCIWALPARGGEGVNASNNLSGIHEVWVTRTLQKLTHFHKLWVVGWRCRRPTQFKINNLNITFWYFWQTLFIPQNEITIRGKKCAVHVQSYNWEESFFSRRRKYVTDSHLQEHNYKVKLVIFVILETSLRFRSYFGSAPCWCEIIYNCGHNYMRSWYEECIPNCVIFILICRVFIHNCGFKCTRIDPPKQHPRASATSQFS